MENCIIRNNQGTGVAVNKNARASLTNCTIENQISAQLISTDDREACKLEPWGQLKPRRSVDIQASPISVGFETLDRYHFDPKRTHPHLAVLGAKWARVQTGWSRCEKRKGVYEFSWLDEIVDDLLAIGVQPFFSLGFGNLLYTPDAPHESARGFVAYCYGEEAAQAWRDYAAIATHFAGRVSHWEVWNEPNVSTFWRPEKPSPAGYVKHLDELVQAKWVLRRILMDLKMELEFTQYYHTVDLFNYITDNGPTGKNLYMGLLRGEDYSPKPSFFGLQTLCSLFDSKTRTWETSVYFENRHADREGRLINPALIQVASFRRGDAALYAYWMPSDFNNPFPGAVITGQFWHGCETPWKKPVLIDPVTQTVFHLPAGERNTAEFGIFDLPLRDGPLLLTDGAMLESEGLV